MAEGAPVDAVTKLEVQAYHAWMSGTLAFEASDWQAAMKVKWSDTLKWANTLLQSDPGFDDKKSCRRNQLNACELYM